MQVVYINLQWVESITNYCGNYGDNSKEKKFLFSQKQRRKKKVVKNNTTRQLASLSKRQLFAKNIH